MSPSKSGYLKIPTEKLPTTKSVMFSTQQKE